MPGDMSDDTYGTMVSPELSRTSTGGQSMIAVENESSVSANMSSGHVSRGSSRSMGVSNEIGSCR